MNQEVIQETNYFVPSTWRRMTARWLDQIFICLIIVSIVLEFPHSEDGYFQIGLIWALLLFSTPVLYEFIFVYMLHTTPGKWICNLKVISASDPKHWGVNSLIRAGLCYVGFFFSALFITALGRYDRRHWADLMAETQVVGLEAINLPKARPVTTVILVIMGLIQGWISFSEQIHSVEYRNGSVYILDPTNFDLAVEDDEE